METVIDKDACLILLPVIVADMASMSVFLAMLGSLFKRSRTGGAMLVSVIIVVATLARWVLPFPLLFEKPLGRLVLLGLSSIVYLAGIIFLVGFSLLSRSEVLRRYPYATNVSLGAISLIGGYGVAILLADLSRLWMKCVFQSAG